MNQLGFDYKRFKQKLDMSTITGYEVVAKALA